MRDGPRRRGPHGLQLRRAGGGRRGRAQVRGQFRDRAGHTRTHVYVEGTGPDPDPTNNHDRQGAAVHENENETEERGAGEGGPTGPVGPPTCENPTISGTPGDDTRHGTLARDVITLLAGDDTGLGDPPAPAARATTRSAVATARTRSSVTTPTTFPPAVGTASTARARTTSSSATAATTTCSAATATT